MDLRVVSVPVLPELAEAMDRAERKRERELGALDPDTRALVERVEREADAELERLYLYGE